MSVMQKVPNKDYVCLTMVTGYTQSHWDLLKRRSPRWNVIPVPGKQPNLGRCCKFSFQYISWKLWAKFFAVVNDWKSIEVTGAAKLHKCLVSLDHIAKQLTERRILLWWLTFLKQYSTTLLGPVSWVHWWTQWCWPSWSMLLSPIHSGVLKCTAITSQQLCFIESVRNNWWYL